MHHRSLIFSPDLGLGYWKPGGVSDRSKKFGTAGLVVAIQRGGICAVRGPLAVPLALLAGAFLFLLVTVLGSTALLIITGVPFFSLSWPLVTT